MARLPLPPSRRLASPHAVHSASRRGRSAPPAGLGSGAACPELGLWAGAQTGRGRPQPAAHVSAGEESAREATCVGQLLGAQGVSLRVCGAADPSQGPWEPGALRSALSLGGQATAERALHLPFPSGVQPRWIQGDSKVGGRSRRLCKNTYLITDIERLEMDILVGRLMEKRELNNLDYVE